MQDRDLYEFNGFRLDVSERAFSRNGEVIKLSEKTFDTLTALVRRANRLATKDELMAEIWPDAFVEENNLDKNISLLRKVLESYGGKKSYIETVRGHGYRLVSDEAVPADPRANDREDGPAQIKPKIVAGKRPQHIPNRHIVLIMTATALLGSIAAYLIYKRSALSPADRSPAVTRIAVLPFKPTVADNRNEALELGMSDALIDKLNAAEGIIVTPLSSVRRYGTLEQDPTEAGRQLNVDAVLEGSIQTSSDRLRVSARLLQVRDGKQLWAQQFDEKFADIFSVQDSISQRVADSLKVRLGKLKRYTVNPEAYGFYLKARYLSQKASARDLAAAIGYLEDALRLDPNFALAYAVLADAYRATVLIQDAEPSKTMPLAKNAALRAIDTDESLAEAHAVLGWVMFWYDWNWEGAELELRRSAELDPKSSDARQFYAHLLSNTGRHDEALTEIGRALEVEPLSLRANALQGVFLFNSGRTDEAIAQLRRTLELQADFRLAEMFLARALNEKGDNEEALSIVRAVQINSKDAVEPRALEAETLARLGRNGEAETILNQLLKEARGRYVSSYSFATIYNSLHQTDKAVDRLEQAFADKDAMMVFLLVDVRWKAVRSDPRFLQLVNRMHFSHR